MSEIQSAELSENPINKLPKEYLQEPAAVNLSSQWMQLINLKEAGKSEVEAAKLYFEKRKNKKAVLAKTKTRYQDKTNKAENNLNELQASLDATNAKLEAIKKFCDIINSNWASESGKQDNDIYFNLLATAFNKGNMDTVMQIFNQKEYKAMAKTFNDVLKDENLTPEAKQKYVQAMQTIFANNLPDHYKALLLLKTGGATKLAKIDNLFNQTENWKANHTAEKNKDINNKDQKSDR